MTKVHAQTDTPEPTVTPLPTSTPTKIWLPLFPTGTTIPTLDVRCPEVTPYGLGTVTPSTNWLYECGDCLLQLTPTSTPAILTLAGTCEEYYGVDDVPENCVTGADGMTCICNDQTLLPTATPTITSTPVYNPEYWIENLGTWTTTCVSGSGWQDCGYYKYLAEGRPTDNVAVAFRIVNSRITSQTDNNTFWDVGSGDEASGIVSQNYTGTLKGGLTYCIDNNLVTGDGCAQFGYTAQSSYKINLKPIMFAQKYTRYKGSATGTIDNIMIMWYGTRPDYVAPTPTVEPGSGYCDYVRDGNGEITQDDLFELPVIKTSAGACQQIFGWHISMDWATGVIGELIDWEISDIDIPGFILCFQPVQFGTLTIFGVSVNLDLLALVMGAVAAIRIFLRS